MKQKSRGYVMVLGAVLFGMATAMAYDAGTAYTVPAGTTVTVIDADIDDFNALASVSFGDAAATLEFNTSKAPTVPISGNGTIRKVSADAWTLDTAQSGFTGTWDFTNGETSLAVRYVLGSETSKSNIYVRAGATLSLDSTDFLFGTRPLHLAGAGFSNQGALRVTVQSNTGSNVLKLTELDDDADIAFVGTAYLFHWAADSNATPLVLNSHTLTLKGEAASQLLYLRDGQLVGPGRIVSTNIANNAKFAGGLSLRGVKILDPSVEIVLTPYTSTQIYNHSPTNYFAKLTVIGQRCRLYHQHQSQSVAGLCTTNLSHDLWAGEVNLKLPTSKLEVGCSVRADDPIKVPYMTGFLGPVTGPGSLAVGTLGDNNQGVCVLSCPTNSYTGSTIYDGSHGAELYVPCSNSIPVYANVSANLPLTLKPNGEEHGWSGASIARFAESITFTGDRPGPCVYVDASALPGDTLAFDGATIANDLTGDVIDGIAGTGGSTLVFRSPLGRPVFPMAVTNSVVKLTGDDTLFVTNPIPKKNTPLRRGEILFDGAKDIRFLPSSPFTMSAAHGAKRYSFKDSVMTQTLNTVEYDRNTYLNDSFTLGYRNGSYVMFGDMFIGEGTVITGRMVLGSTSYTYGRIVQTGGVVAVKSNCKDSGYQSALGYAEGSQSYYELVDGSFTSLGSFTLGQSGCGVFRQRGGEFSIVMHPNSSGVTDAVAWLNLSYGLNSRSHFIAEGGTTLLTSVILAGRNTGFRTAFTVAGDAEVTSKANFAYGYASGITYLNLNGGT